MTAEKEKAQGQNIATEGILPETLPGYVSYDIKYYAHLSLERKFDQIVDQVQSEKYVYKQIVNIWEPTTGSGKTWLLKYLQETYRYKAEQKQEEGKKKTVSLYFDLKDKPYEPDMVIDAFEEQLVEQLGDEFKQTPEFSRYQEKKAQADPLQAFRGLMTEFNTKYAPVILFDSADNLIPSGFEQEFLGPLYETTNSLIVLATHNPIPIYRLKNRAVRNDLEDYKMSDYQADDFVTEILQKADLPHSDEFVDVITSLSFGHPFAAYVFGCKLSEFVKQGIQPKDIIRLYPHKIDEIYCYLEKGLMKDVPEDEWETIRSLTFTDAFNVEEMYFILKKFLSEENYSRLKTKLKKGESQEDLSDKDILLLIGILKETHLVYWDKNVGMYIVAPHIKHMFQRHLQLIKPEKFKDKHTQAFEYNLEKAENSSGSPNSVRHLLKTFYQFGYLSSVDSPENIMALASQLMERVDSSWEKMFNYDNSSKFNSYYDSLNYLFHVFAHVKYNPFFIIPPEILEFIQNKLLENVEKHMRKYRGKLTKANQDMYDYFKAVIDR
jgi:hypothetical protein